MKIREYLERKYGRERSLGLLACEAKVLGIPYPLRQGWMTLSGENEITERQRIALIAALRKSKSEHAQHAISVLAGPDNPRLLNAAPDLLAALRAAVASGIIDHNGEPEAARAAILKATGGVS